MLENPFITYGYESPEYFCDRENETRELIKLLVNGNNTALISPRRMGKTGLIHHVYTQPQIKDQFFTFLVDIYATKNLQDFVFQLGYAIVSKLKSKGQKVTDRFLQFVSSLRTGIAFDGQGNASWNLDIGDIKLPEFTMEEIFNYLNDANKRCIIAIDEFQTIASYPEQNTEALIRTYVQKCRNATFIFAGSQQSMMSEMFSSPARPFYQSVSLMFLKPVGIDQYKQFAVSHFQSKRKNIDEKAVEMIYQEFEGVTWYMQKMLNQIFSNTADGEEAKEKDVEKARDQILGQNEEAYKDLLYLLTVKQRNLLIAICKEKKVTHLTKASFINRHKLQSSSSIQKSKEILLKKQLITCHQGVYEPYDKFMGEWISRYF